MNRLSYQELTWNLEAAGIHPVHPHVSAAARSPQIPSHHELLDSHPCPICRHIGRRGVLFRNEAEDENQWYALCPRCGHCQRI